MQGAPGISEGNAHPFDILRVNLAGKLRHAAEPKHRLLEGRIGSADLTGLGVLPTGRFAPDGCPALSRSSVRNGRKADIGVTPVLPQQL